MMLKPEMACGIDDPVVPAGCEELVAERAGEISLSRPADVISLATSVMRSRLVSFIGNEGYVGLCSVRQGAETTLAGVAGVRWGARRRRTGGVIHLARERIIFRARGREIDCFDTSGKRLGWRRRHSPWASLRRRSRIWEGASGIVIRAGWGVGRIGQVLRSHNRDYCRCSLARISFAEFQLQYHFIYPPKRRDWAMPSSFWPSLRSLLEGVPSTWRPPPIIAAQSTPVLEGLSDEDRRFVASVAIWEATWRRCFNRGSV